jgi:peptidoglycan-associated lipoprotein
MKRTLLVVAMLMFVVALAGCHGKKVKPATTPGETTTPSTGEVAKQPKEAEKPVTPIPQPELAGAALKDIHFDYDKYNITDEASDILSANGEYIMNHSDVRILIEGHCDERGTEEYNLALGEKRALAARDYLVRFGIDKSRISIISYGEERPEDLGGTEEAWAKNRRDHFAPK